MEEELVRGEKDEIWREQEEEKGRARQRKIEGLSKRKMDGEKDEMRKKRN